MTETHGTAQPFVVAIGGPSGSGKTTLVKRTAAFLKDATTLFFDDYASVSTYPRAVGEWVQAGADPNEWKTPAFASDLMTLRRGQPISSPGGNRQVRVAYLVINRAALSTCDLVLDGLRPIDELAEQPLEYALS